MTSATRLDGEPVAAPVRDRVADRVRALEERGVTPTLGTVLASDDPADERFVELKHEAADAVGIGGRDVRLAPSAPTDRVERAVARLNDDDAVHGVFVQAPFPPLVDEWRLRRAMDPRKDVDCFHPANLGRLVAGHPWFLPATPAAVLRLLAHYDVPLDGRDVALVGRSPVIGRPLANLLWQDATPGNATVTVCHSRTRDLASRTRRADVVVTAAGQPGLVDGAMLSPGTTVVDVSANRVTTDDGRGHEVVGDVAFEGAAAVVDAVTPVPGGVGPVTLATLLENVVLAAERAAGVEPVDAGWPP